MVKIEEAEKKIRAALQLLTQEKVTFQTFEDVLILLKGANPRVDKHLTTCSGAIKELKKIQEGAVIELSAEALPENTEKQKRRKKALLLFIRAWKDLLIEVKRLEQIYNSQSAQKKLSTKQKVTTLGKVVAFAKGPGGLITIVAAGIVAAGNYLNSAAVEVVIKNDGCPPFESNISLPISIPGLKLPSEVIPAGGQGIAKVPPLKVVVDGTKEGLISLTTLGKTMQFELPANPTELSFNGGSVLGASTTIDLKEKKHHELVISCEN